MKTFTIIVLLILLSASSLKKDNPWINELEHGGHIYLNLHDSLVHSESCSNPKCTK
jgi:hypothetical protein